MASVKPGWFVDPDDETLERWWFGRAWGSETRPLQEGTPVLPKGGKEPPTPPGSRSTSTAASSSGLQMAGNWMYLLAALAALGAVIIAVILIAHTVPQCTPNPYNDALGTNLQDCTKTHPWVGSGITAGVAGLIQAVVLGVVGRLCHVVDELRRAAAPASE